MHRWAPNYLKELKGVDIDMRGGVGHLIDFSVTTRKDKLI